MPMQLADAFHDLLLSDRRRSSGKLDEVCRFDSLQWLLVALALDKMSSTAWAHRDDIDSPAQTSTTPTETTRLWYPPLEVSDSAG